LIKILINSLFTFCYLWINVSGKTISVSNEKELINSFVYANNNSTNELLININNVNIDIFNTINVESSINKLYVIGSSKENSILNFKNINHGLIITNLFNNEIQEFNIVNVTINGHLEIRKGININFDNVNINGSLDFDKLFEFTWEGVSWEEYMLFWDNYIDRYINLNQLTFYAISEERENCVNLYGHVNINNSEFHGSPLCKDSLVNIYGHGLTNVDISNSHFDGAYSNTCVTINDAIFSTIIDSVFEKGNANFVGG